MTGISNHDPYKNFKFRVKWDGKYVAGISKMSALKSTTEVVLLRQGSSLIETKTPGRTSFEPITLERGVTYDQAFSDWAAQVWAAPGSSSASGLRKDLIVELQNAAGKPIAAYKLHRCWVSEYQALPDLDANANAVAIEHIKLENEGWERDDSLVMPPP